MTNPVKFLYRRALTAMSNRFWRDELPHVGPLWAHLAWKMRRFLPHSWWQ